ncbi:MAG: hypothetical protein H6607_02270 [Flavobacteriales bacterium]|nr:hypothetical protein [Flavobacteriales bacterium]
MNRPHKLAGAEIICREIVSDISFQLDKAGLLYRIFSRVKALDSIGEKFIRKKSEGESYSNGGKMLQDFIGIRVTSYFHDDIHPIMELIKSLSKYKIVDEKIDLHSSSEFKPKRTNIVCKMSESQKEDFSFIIRSLGSEYEGKIDSTFEIQLRTIISEGWHEIDHNLRYKCKEDWISHLESDRMLNGIYASLETNEVALKEMFERLAYNHYKEKNWDALLRTKFRLRLQLDSISNELKAILDADNELGKKILKAERAELIKTFIKLTDSVPVTMDNIIYIINLLGSGNEKILYLTPKTISQDDIFKKTNEQKLAV